MKLFNKKNKKHHPMFKHEKPGVIFKTESKPKFHHISHDYHVIQNPKILDTNISGVGTHVQIKNDTKSTSHHNHHHHHHHHSKFKSFGKTLKNGSKKVGQGLKSQGITPKNIKKATTKSLKHVENTSSKLLKPVGGLMDSVSSATKNIGEGIGGGINNLTSPLGLVAIATIGVAVIMFIK